MDDSPLTAGTILADLGTTLLPRNVQCYAQVTSTMDVARAAMQTATPDSLPTLILAETQTSGRGRAGRPWATTPGTALLFSLLLQPHWLDIGQAQALVWMTGVAMCEGIEAATGLQPRLKWPNDVLLPVVPDAHTPPHLAQSLRINQNTQTNTDWRKTAGILLEMSSMEQAVEFAIIGCGLNVHANPPPDTPLRYGATNLSAALGQPVARLAVLRAMLRRFDYWYTRLQNGDFVPLFQTWRALLLTIGQDVQVRTATAVYTGRAEEVDLSGALHVRDAAGVLHVVSSGDVHGQG